MDEKIFSITFFTPDVRVSRDQGGQATHIRELLTNWSHFVKEVVLICYPPGLSLPAAGTLLKNELINNTT